jgi:FAD:protein FMN transferase
VQLISPMPLTAQRSFATSRLRVALGTFVAIDAEASSAAAGESAIAAAYAAIALVQNLMRPTRAGSDLAALSECALGDPCRVHPWTWAVLDLCKRLSLESRGIFDPCIPELSVPGLSGSASWGSLADLELLEPQCAEEASVIPHARLRLDLGGIAKGFAVDRAIDALRAAGCHAGLVNAGGDLAVFGDQDRDVICRHSRGESIVTLRNAALASSAVENEAQPAEHRGYYNAADQSAIVSGSVTITAPHTAIADGLTKCSLASDSASNIALLDTFGARRIEW